MQQTPLDGVGLRAQHHKVKATTARLQVLTPARHAHEAVRFGFSGTKFRSGRHLRKVQIEVLDQTRDGLDLSVLAVIASHAEAPIGLGVAADAVPTLS